MTQQGMKACSEGIKNKEIQGKRERERERERLHAVLI
jgi:hypothetical protein